MRDTRSTFVGGIRLAIGAGLLLMPRFSARLWAGEGAVTPTGRMFARAIGARDVVLGATLLKALQDEKPHGDLLLLGVAADAADVVAALLMGRQLDRTRRILVPLAAGGVAVTGYLAGKAIDRS